MTSTTGPSCTATDRPPFTRIVPVALDRPLVGLGGRITCRDPAEAGLAQALLPEHIRLSRAEPGCLRFDLWQDADDPLVWHLSELFADEAAFAAHGARTRASAWGQSSTAIRRDIDRHDVAPVIRAETPDDAPAIDALLRRAFGGGDEAALMKRLRDDGDLALSLLACAGGVTLGHVALSPLEAEGPAFLMAPVAVDGRVRGRGIAAAMVRAALAWARPASVVVVGHPGLYSQLGFRPIRLTSPYAGLSLQMVGDLAADSTMRPARAFLGL